MTTAAEPGEEPGIEEVAFRHVTGQMERIRFTVLADEPGAPEHLTARRVKLADGTELRQVRVAGPDRDTGYARLDNEILAGRRLYEVSREVGYPREVSAMFGDEDTSADPCALLVPYQGQALEAARIAEDEVEEFAVSLLNGLCWLAAAGIAHRGLGPKTVRWLGHQVQIADFSRSAIFGLPREVIGAPPWAGPEQRPARLVGEVSMRDDIWAAGQLIFYMRAGEYATGQGQLREWGLDSLLEGVFNRPEKRPTAREILEQRLHRPCPVPEGLDSREWLRAGIARFIKVRGRKHPGAAVPVGLLEDGPGPGGGASRQRAAAETRQDPAMGQADSVGGAARSGAAPPDGGGYRRDADGRAGGTGRWPRFLGGGR